jgi:hypothetical protein
MPAAGFEPKNPASEGLKTDALDHAATGISGVVLLFVFICLFIYF